MFSEIGNRLRRRRRNRQTRCETIDERFFEPGVNTTLSGRDAVVVVRRVKRLRGVLDVMRGGTGKQHRLLRSQSVASRKAFERPSKVAGHLRQAPWQCAEAF